MAKKTPKSTAAAAIENVVSSTAPALKKISNSAVTAKRHVKAKASVAIAVAEAVVDTFIQKSLAPHSPAKAPASEHEIAQLAYSYWLERGCQGGSPAEDWLRAEQSLNA